MLAILRRDLGLFQLQLLPRSARGDLPISTLPRAARPPRTATHFDEPTPPSPWAGSSADFTSAYLSKKTTPSEILKLVLEGASYLDHVDVGPLLGKPSALVHDDAKASTERYSRGAPLGPLDGVPVVVKEQIAVRGLPTLAGTNYFPDEAAKEDAFTVRMLREAGALIIGHTVMTELGLSPLGNNPFRKMPRNPFAPGYMAGGSSTGSGVAVATGLVPIAVGVDGGGSVRIPAAHNGIFGLKATWGRISREGDILKNSLNHIGPMASSVIDLARALDVMSAMNPEDEEMRRPEPPGTFERATKRSIKGLVIGYDRKALDDATSDMRFAAERALRYFEEGGAKLKELSLPIANVSVQIGVLTLGIEALAAIRLIGAENLPKMGADVRIILSALQHMPSLDLADALLLRAGLREEMQKAFQSIDLLLLPTTQGPPSAAFKNDRLSSLLDGRAIQGSCRYTFLANLTGHPAGTAPVGYVPEGVPLGVQLIGDAYDDATVLAGLAYLERIGRTEVRRPDQHVRVLK